MKALSLPLIFVFLWRHSEQANTILSKNSEICYDSALFLDIESNFF